MFVDVDVCRSCCRRREGVVATSDAFCFDCDSLAGGGRGWVERGSGERDRGPRLPGRVGNRRQSGQRPPQQFTDGENVTTYAADLSAEQYVKRVRVRCYITDRRTSLGGPLVSHLRFRSGGNLFKHEAGSLDDRVRGRQQVGQQQCP